MANENPQPQPVSTSNIRIRDLEEKNRILRNQVLLIGRNLVEVREKNNEEILEIKKELELVRQNLERLTSFLEMASEEFSKFARREDLEILSKQARMFQPLELRKKEKR